MRNRQSLAKLPPKWDTSFDCNDPWNQGYLTNLHQITQTDYVLMVESFFFGTVPPPKSKAASDIVVSPEAQVPCGSNYIQYTFDESVLLNDDIDVDVVPGIIGKYSIPLFRGIKTLFEPDFFHFSKAIGFDGKVTLAFYATRGNDTVYFGDLAGLYP